MASPSLPKAEVHAKIREWVNNPRSYCRDLLKVQSTQAGLVPLRLNKVQEVFFKIIDDIRSKGRLVRIVVLKARRFGISTATSGRFFHGVVTRPNRYAMVMAHDPDSADFLFGMYRRYYSVLPEPMRPSTKYNSTRKLEFQRKDGKGLDSAIRVSAAGKEDVGSGMKIDYAHISEFSKYPQHTSEAILTSVMQCVPREPHTEVIIESTAKGMGGLFYDKFTTARYVYTAFLDSKGEVDFKCEVNYDVDEDNDWSSIFLPWFVFDEYAMKLQGETKCTPEEIALKELYGLTNHQLTWRRWAIQSNCGGSLDIFHQEYPSTSQEAFLSTGSPVFEPMLVQEGMQKAPPPIARYECQFSTGNFISKPDGDIKVWQEPIPGRAYIMSADVAEGIEVNGDAEGFEKHDSSVVDVIDQLTGEQVLNWRGKTPPDLLGVLMFHIGRRYNMAWACPERNNHGNTTVTKLFDMGYKRIYTEKTPDPPNRPRKRFGWLTTRSSKPLIIDNLAAEVREKSAKINCKETWMEMSGYKREADGSMGTEKGRHDDRVMSIAIAKYIRTRLPMPAGMQKVSSIDTWAPAPPTTPKPSSKGWL